MYKEENKRQQDDHQKPQSPLPEEKSEAAVDKAQTESAEESENSHRENNRSRRLPRHLRMNSRERRHYQETVSPMPLFMAVASPELASGKNLFAVCEPCRKREK
ncbi:hypothetical protein INT80_03645 [Gallibacterium anatis]|uniref:Uncharacterized protein n=1 Tax=Gallibacterium anatis TaxID=750 RepID=A0A930UUB3_9PAST|nr:hypothetical protein [Gallibacterium anatis]